MKTLRESILDDESEIAAEIQKTAIDVELYKHDAHMFEFSLGNLLCDYSKPQDDHEIDEFFDMKEMERVIKQHNIPKNIDKKLITKNYEGVKRYIECGITTFAKYLLCFNINKLELQGHDEFVNYVNAIAKKGVYASVTSMRFGSQMNYMIKYFYDTKGHRYAPDLEKIVHITITIPRKEIEAYSK